MMVLFSRTELKTDKNQQRMPDKGENGNGL